MSIKGKIRKYTKGLNEDLITKIWEGATRVSLAAAHPDNPDIRRAKFTRFNRLSKNSIEYATIDDCITIAIELINSYHNESTCTICGSKITKKNFELNLKDPQFPEIDHIIPRIHKPGNVQWVHRICNIMKSNLNINEFNKIITNIYFHQNKEPK